MDSVLTILSLRYLLVHCVSDFNVLTNHLENFLKSLLDWNET
jgi:hypothetical protein